MALTTQSAERKDRNTADNGPTLEHRHFAFIAATIADIGKQPGYASHAALVAEQFADACARTNPKFNRARFLRACNVEG